jgi:hypothetical protein
MVPPSIEKERAEGCGPKVAEQYLRHSSNEGATNESPTSNPVNLVFSMTWSPHFVEIPHLFKSESLVQNGKQTFPVVAPGLATVSS